MTVIIHAKVVSHFLRTVLGKVFVKTPSGFKTLCNSTARVCETTACNMTLSNSTMCHCETTLFKASQTHYDDKISHLCAHPSTSAKGLENKLGEQFNNGNKINF